MTSRSRPEDEEAVASPPGEAPAPEGSETGLEPAPGPEGAPEDSLAALRQEVEDLREQLLRRRADFENLKRRMERDRHAAAQEALAAVFREMVTTVDNLERALASEGGPEELRQGVELTHRDLVGLLESHDVVALDPQGAPFDPTLHQALLHEPVPGLSEGTVAEVFRKGYSFGDRLLRPALVKVAKGEEDDAAAVPVDEGEPH